MQAPQALLGKDPCPPAGLFQSPLPDGYDQARFLGKRKEIRREDQTQVRVLPAQQRLHADRAPSWQVGYGLELQDEFTVLDGAAQRLLQVQALAHTGIDRLTVEGAAVTSARLGLAHGIVGLADQYVDLGPVVRTHADSDAHRHL